MFPDAESLIGRAIGSYRLVQILGSGGAGSVFLGQSITTPAEQVAIKVMMPPAQLSRAGRDDFRKRFLREAQTLRQLRHPHIVSIIAAGEVPEIGLAYMILPYMTGGTLANRLRAGPLPLNDVARYLSQLAGALDYAHQRGIVHRDIKPANVLLDAHGDAYLADFGIAKLFDFVGTTLTTTGQIIGTPEYMAPEQASSGKISPATDVYGLGILAYHLLTGKLPFQGETFIQVAMQIMETPPPSPIRLRPDLPAAANATILQALEKSPGKRYPSAGTFAAAFARGISGGFAVNPQWGGETLSIAGEERAPPAMRVGRVGTANAPTESGIPQREPAKWQAAPRRRRRSLPVLTVALLVVMLAASGVLYADRGNIFHQTQGAISLPPHPTSTLTSPLTPTPTPQPLKSYAAQSPGPCDMHGAAWSVSSQANLIHCDGQGMEVMPNTGLKVFFLGLPHTYLSSNYRIQVDVSGLTSNDCFELAPEISETSGYAITVCEDGAWQLLGLSSAGETDLQSSAISPTSTFQITFTSDGASKTLNINGKTVLSAGGHPYPQSAIHDIRFELGNSATLHVSNFSFQSL